MGLIEKEQIKKEQEQKRANYALQGTTNIYAGNWAPWIKKSDTSNRYNIKTSRFESIRSAKSLGLVSLAAMAYLTKNEIPADEELQRDDYKPLETHMQQPTLKDFLKSLFGSPTEVDVQNCLHSLGEEYLYYLNVEPTENELKEFVEKIENADLSSKELIHFYLLFSLYNEDPVSPLFKTVEDKYASTIMQVSKLDKLSDEKLEELKEDLREGYKFWSFLIPKMEGNDAREFKTKYRKYFVPTKESAGKTAEPEDRNTLVLAVTSGLATLTEMTACVNKLLNPFPGYEKVVYKTETAPVQEVVPSEEITSVAA